jgi:hypothetical protein
MEFRANYTQYVSTVDELAPGVTNIFLGGFVTPNIRLVAGDEYGQIYGSKYQRNAAGQMLLVLQLVLPLHRRRENRIQTLILQWFNTFTTKNFSLYFLLDIREGDEQYSRNIADVQNGVV